MARWLRVFQWAWALRFAVSIAFQTVPQAFGLDLGLFLVFAPVAIPPALVAVAAFAVVRASEGRLPRALAAVSCVVNAAIAIHWTVRLVFAELAIASVTKGLDAYAPAWLVSVAAIPLVAALIVLARPARRHALVTLGLAAVVPALAMPFWWSSVPVAVVAFVLGLLAHGGVLVLGLLLARRASGEPGPSADVVVLGALRTWLVAFVALAATATWVATFGASRHADLELQAGVWGAIVAAAAIVLAREAGRASVAAAIVAITHFVVVWFWDTSYTAVLDWARASGARTLWIRANTFVTVTELVTPYLLVAACAAVVARFADRQEKRLVRRLALALVVFALPFAPWAAWLEIKSAQATPLEIQVLRRSVALLWVALAVLVHLLTRPTSEENDEPPEVTVGGVD